MPPALRSMRWYPTVRARRSATIAADVFIVVLVMIFAWFAASAHDAVDGLGQLARGVEQAGAETQASLDAAAERVGAVPVVGGALADALREAGGSTGGDTAALARSGRRDIEHAANVIGWALFLIPTTLLLVGYLPNRWSQVKRLTAAQRILGDGSAVDSHPRLVAMRAAFGLPYPTLMRYTDDPFGDLEAGRYHALVEAAHEEAGLAWDPDPGARRRARY
jgi:hypothetical protein